MKAGRSLVITCPGGGVGRSLVSKHALFSRKRIVDLIRSY